METDRTDGREEVGSVSGVGTAGAVTPGAMSVFISDQELIRTCTFCFPSWRLEEGATQKIILVKVKGRSGGIGRSGVD